MSMRFDAMSPEIVGAVTNDLHLIVNPTERCNLRCGYCYETFHAGEDASDNGCRNLQFGEAAGGEGG